MRLLKWQGKLLLATLLAAFAVPGMAEADPGRGKRDRDRDRGRFSVRGDFARNRDYGYRDYSYRGYGYRDEWRGRRVGWRGCDLPPGLARKYGCRSGYVHSHYPRYPERYPRSGRRGSVGVVIHIPF